MASTNQSPQYQKAEVMFLQAITTDEKLRWLDEMIKECPKHKSAEKMLAQLKTRRKKLLEKQDKDRKKGKSGSGKKVIKKEEMQVVIIGQTNSGKSTLLSTLTNASPEIADYDFTTKEPIVGTMDYQGMKIQIIEIPAIGSEYYDKGLANTADVILILIRDVNEIGENLLHLDRAPGRKLIVFNAENKTDTRKVESTLKSKRYNFSIVKPESKEGLENLKEKIFSNFGKIRVFTKPDTQKSKKSDRPLILEKESIVKDIARKIIKDISKIKETKIWGPSSKFPGQVVGMSHVLKDMDTIEFKTR